MGIHVRGDFHQGDARFEGQGRQCTAMAMRAVAHHCAKDVSLWTTQDLDEILHDGDRLYMSAAEAHDVTVLFPSEAISTVTIDGLQISLHVDNNRNGVLGSMQHLGEKTVPLQHALEQIEGAAIFTVGGVFSSYTVAIMKVMSTFYVFDSHCRDGAGLCHPGGRSCVTMHQGMNDLKAFVYALCMSLGMDTSETSDTLFDASNVRACVEMTGGAAGHERGVPNANCDMTENDPAILSQFDEEDDIPLLHCTQPEKDDIHLIHLTQWNEEDVIPLSHLTQWNKEDDVPLSHLTQWNEEDDVPLIQLRRQAEDSIPLKNINSSSEQEYENVQFTTPNQGLSPERTKSVTLSEHLSSGDEYVPSQEELRELECSSPEMDCDDDHDDADRCRPVPEVSEQASWNNMQDNLNASVTSNTSIGSPTAWNSQSTSPCPLPTQDKPRLSRKRMRDESSWKINQRKRQRDSGESYVSRTGKVKRKRALKSGCGDRCRNKCRSKISEDERAKIFHSFWKLGCLMQQRQYLCKTVKKIEKKSTRSKSASRRSFTYGYCLHIDGKIVPVCKKMFLDTLDISDTVVATALQKRNCLGTSDAESRGKQRGNVKDSEKDQIRKHINSFPRVESHYARRDTTREYFECSLSLQTMHALYVEKRKKEGFQTPACETTYRNVFNREFNISFQKRTKDRCDVCAAHDNGYFSDTDMDDYKKHIRLKEESRKLKDEVKEKVKHDPSLVAAVFDLEEVLPTPSSVESCFYYKRKLNTYNLTVYDYRNGQGYCNVWEETTALRGSTEIGSCVYRYLERISREGCVKKVMLFSDSCGGQNRNRNFLTMLWYALRKFKFEEIEHVFFVSGHSQNEGDSMHSVIERKSRNILVFTTSQWAQTMRVAKRKAPLYIVEELVQSDFFDFKKVAGLLKNFQLDTQKEKVRWLDTKRFRLTSQEPNVVSFGYDYSGELRQVNLVQKVRVVNWIPDPVEIELQNVSKVPYPISKEKYEDLISLCESCIIPKSHHVFFRSLPHEA